LGEALPALKGISLKTGEGLDINASRNHRLAILVFQESCPFCEANWKNWEALFAKGDSSVPVIMVTVDGAISNPYRATHPLLNRGTVVLGVDPATLSKLAWGSTPQTIYLVDGKIAHNWIGLLSSADVKEITAAVS